MKIRIPASVGILAAFVAPPAIAQDTPSDLRDLVGARAAGGETQLEERGFVWISTQTGADRKWSYWWNQSRNMCLTVQTYDGRYASVVDSPPQDCERAHGGDEYAAQNGSEVINLICFGEGNRLAAEAHGGYEWDWDEHKYRYSTRTETRRQEFDEALTLQFHGEDGRIRLAGKLIPPIHSGGTNGWWTLTDVQITAERIKGRYRLNGLNKPRLEIDRRSGHIKIEGMTGFNGTCQSIDQGERRF